MPSGSAARTGMTISPTKTAATARGRTMTAPVRWHRALTPKGLRPFHLDFDEGDRMRRPVHDVVLYAGRPPVRLPRGELDRGLAGAVVNPQRAGIEHDDEIRPAMLVPAGHRAGLEVPARDAHDVVVLLHTGDRRDGARKGHD